MSDTNDKGVAVVIGAGDATGGAVARRFARAGHVTCLTRRHGDKLEPLCQAIRDAGGVAHGFGVDARREDQMVPFFERVERDIGAIAVTVFNVGGNVNFPITETTLRVYYKVWQMACFAGFLTGREAARHMVPRGRGTIIFTGATASVMGRQGFAAFAGGKFGLRALAQSLAREIGPHGIHVAHSIIDGPIDTPFIRENMQDAIAARDYEDNLLAPEDIAEAYYRLHRQPRGAWTQELDLRPWAERW